ncbi:MAG TPA: SDR family NAD(P)-dependent oxidoreductase, partial [Candidatus Angelobacter sp.]|nr:SDR family NAD(P)-dependent oxidoreductase [Candidatus Angelobacter sp.]
MSGLRLLRSLGIEASVAAGHSLGELVSLCWAGAMDEETLLRVVAERGRVMSQLGDPAGSMASIQAACEDVKHRLNGDPIVVAADNSPTQTVVSGKAFAVKRFLGSLSAHGITATMLPVSHAFHSPLMADAATAFSRYLKSERLSDVNQKKRIVSTVTGTAVEENADLRQLLTDQVTMPVLFAKAAARIAAETDLLIEVGPGSILTGIVSQQFDIPAVSLDVGGESLRGLLTAAGAAFALGAPVQAKALFADRFYRHFDLQHRHRFLQNPCESAPDTKIDNPVAPAPAVAVKPLPAVPLPPDISVLETLRSLVAQRTQLPLETILPQNRFLDDLHLNSISISQIVLEAAAQSGSVAPVSPAEFTNATLSETAQILKRNRHRAASSREQKYPAGAESWIRTLAIELVEKPLRPSSTQRRASGQWQVMAMEQSDFTQSLAQQLESVAGRGIICCVPRMRTADSAGFLLRSIQRCVKEKVEQVVFVQHGGGVEALARSLFLEHREMTVTVVDVSEASEQTAQLIASEAIAASAFTEAVYDMNGIRREPQLKVLWPEQSGLGSGLGADDLLLVTGGGKGITAECALTLARASGCRLALLGRSHPERDEELRNNLDRFRNANVKFGYFSVELTDEAAVSETIQQIQSELGTVTAVLHGAGINNPQPLEDLTERDLRTTLDVKVTALRNILKAFTPTNLRLLLTFGSIIGRTGLQGEGHYGLANEWLRMEVEEWQHQHPACRCLNLEWSVWAGVGMGQRLGVLDSLQQQGITPLPLDQALSY